MDEYKGYTITETEDGYWQVDQYEFPTYEEALDWIDSMEDTPRFGAPKLHTYQVSYVTKKGYSDYDIVKAYTKSGAQDAVAEKYPDLQYFAGTFRLDED